MPKVRPKCGWGCGADQHSYVCEPIRAATETDILTFREGETWIVAWRYYDIVVQGPTREMAFERFMRTLAAQCIWDARDGVAPFSRTPSPPPDILAEWEREHAVEYGKTLSPGEKVKRGP